LPQALFGHDHDGKLVSTIYMVPLSAMKADMKLDNLKVGNKKVDHVDMYYNAATRCCRAARAYRVVACTGKREARVAK